MEKLFYYRVAEQAPRWQWRKKDLCIEPATIQFGRESFRAIFESSGPEHTLAAEILGTGRTTLWRKMRHHGLKSSEWRLNATSPYLFFAWLEANRLLKFGDER